MHDDGGGNKAEPDIIGGKRGRRGLFASETQFLRWDWHEYARVTMGWSFEKKGVFLEIIRLVWAQQRLPEDWHRIHRIDPRTLRRFVDDDFKAAVSAMCRQRTPIDRSDRSMAYKAANGRCHYCGDELSPGWHMDHVVPIAKGGLSNRKNLVASCPDCNRAKGART